MINYDFKNKVVLVTGSSRGIGKEVAYSFLKSGAVVILTGRKITTNSKLRNQLKNYKNKFILYDVDFRNIEEITKLYEFIFKKFKTLNILVNNAGETLVKKAIDINIKEYDNLFNINLRSLFFLSSIFAKKIIQQKNKGVIVNISSQVAHVGGPLRSIYSATKGAVNSLTRSLALEWASKKIRVVAVSPTFTKTEMMKNSSKNIEFKKMIKTIPAGRPATVNEIASAVLYLSSDEAEIITGEVLRVDGGYSIK